MNNLDIDTTLEEMLSHLGEEPKCEALHLPTSQFKRACTVKAVARFYECSGTFLLCFNRTRDILDAMEKPRAVCANCKKRLSECRKYTFL